MPIATVQLPDGRVATLEVPEGTTPEQVQQFVEQQLSGAAEEPVAPSQDAQAPQQPRSDFLDPNIVKRGTVLPIGTTAAGEEELALPQILADVVRGGELFGRAARGETIQPEEVTSAALALSPPGLKTGARVAGRAIPREQIVGREVVAAGEREGVDVLTTDVVKPKGIIGGLARQVGERIPFAGTGGVRAGQRVQREQAVERFISEFPPASNDDIVASLRAQTSKVKRAAGNVLEGFKTRLTEQGDVNTQNIVTAFDKAIADLSKPGRLKDPASVELLIKKRTEFLEAPQDFTMLRENRTIMRELAETQDPFGRSQLPSSSKSRFKNIEKAFTETMDNIVLEIEGATGLAKYKKADAVWASEAQKLTKTRLKNVLDKGDITPETVESVLFSAKPSEVGLLHSSLTAEGKAAARSALISRAVEKAGGVDDLSPTKFGNELKKLRENTGVFFQGPDLKRLRGLEILLRHTKQAQEGATVGPTGQALQPIVALIAGSVAGLPATIAAAGTAGISARIYESPAVRNMLLQLSNSGGKPAVVNKILGRHERGVAAVLQAVTRQQALQQEQSVSPDDPIRRGFR